MAGGVPGPHGVWRDELIGAKFKQLMEAGHSPKYIAKELGLRPAQVNCKLQRERMKKATWYDDPALHERALEMLKNSFTTLAIAAAMGVTKGSVSGWRERLIKNNPDIKAQIPVRKKRDYKSSNNQAWMISQKIKRAKTVSRGQARAAADRPPSKIATFIDLPQEEPTEFNVGMADLAHHHCRWPVSGDPKDTDTFRFCGKPRESLEPGFCYCAAHHQRAKGFQGMTGAIKFLASY